MQRNKNKNKMTAIMALVIAMIMTDALSDGNIVRFNVIKNKNFFFVFLT